MRKLLYIFLVPLFFVACEDDGEIIDVPTEVYGAEKMNINIEGIDSDALVNPSTTFSNGKTVTLNNIIDVNRSVIGTYGDNYSFNIETKTARETSKIKGELKGGKIEITGTVKYTQAGTSRVYSDKTLIVGGAAAPKGASAEIKFAGTNDEPDKASVILKGLVTGSEDDKKPFTVEGTLVKENTDNTFTVAATGKDKNIVVTISGTFVNGIFAITISTAPAPEEPEKP